MVGRRREQLPRWLRRRRAILLEGRAMAAAEARRQAARRRVIGAGLALLAALALAWLALTARPARGAIRVPLEWTAPDSVRSIEVIARRPDGVVLALTPYADSTGSSPPPLVAAGDRQRCWVLVSEDWRAGGWMLWVRACNAAGCAPWSNGVVVAAGVPDTLWSLVRPDRGDGIRPPRDGVHVRRASRRVGWSLQPGDTAWAAIEHQELVQLRWRERICELFADSSGAGYWVRRGQREACP